MRIYLNKDTLFLILGVILGVLGLYIWMGVFSRTPKQVLLKSELEKESEKYPHIRPLVLPWDKNLNKSRELLPFAKDIQAVIDKHLQEKKASKIAYYFRDLNDGPWIGINTNTSFNLASLLKVPVLMSYYRWAEEDPKVLQMQFVFNGESTNRSDYSILTKPKTYLEKGKSYTVDSLISKMITESDNDAFNMLVNHIDVGLLSDPYNLTETEIQSKDQDYTGTLKDYSAFIRALYNASYLTRPYSEKALSLLAKSSFKSGLVAGVPKNIEVAHKFGVRENTDDFQLHDCGIVYYPRYPYLICIMTQGDSLESLTGVIKDLSQISYKQVRQQLK